MLDLSGIVSDSIVDGPGIRVTVFCQGCPHHCPGCHNPETWEFGCGTAVEEETVLDIVRSNPLCRGVTFSGGEPFAQAAAFAKLARLLKEKGFSQDELDAACEHICGEEIIAAEDMDYRSKRLFRHHSFGFPQTTTQEIADLIHSLSKEEVTSALNQLLEFDKAALLVYGNNPTESFQKKIRALV